MTIWSYFRRRRERVAAIEADADRLVLAHGQLAYSAAMAILHKAAGRDQRRHWFGVRRLIAKRDGRKIGLDAADRWIDAYGDPTPSGAIPRPETSDADPSPPRGPRHPEAGRPGSPMERDGAPD